MSYSRDDGEYVGRLVRWLDVAGIEVWFDLDIPTGQRWAELLHERIESCQALLLVMSPAAGASKWVAKEVAYALELEKPVLPLQLDGGILFGLRHLQVEDVRGGVMPQPAFADWLREVAPVRRVMRHQVGVVPAEADCFQHRAVAEQLDIGLSPGGTAILSGSGAKTDVLSGLGGVGKTQLAASVARGMRDSGRLDLLSWISARSRDSIVTGYASAAAEVLGADFSDPVRAAQAFLAHLAITTSRWLIVLDDLADPNDLSDMWPPRTAAGRVVVTTRRRDPALSTHGRIVAVDLFTPEEAYDYLAAKFSQERHRLAEARELIDDLGRLPVALAQAAAYVAERDLTCAQYRQRFARHHLAALAPSAWPDEYTRSVAVTLSLAVEAADHLDPAGLAKPLLTVLSLLDPNGIPATLTTSAPIVEFLGTRTGSIVDSEAARDALTCLSRLNLTVAARSQRSDSPSTEESEWISVHALIQRAMRDQVATNILDTAVLAAADALVEIWPEVEREAALGQGLRANAAALRTATESWSWGSKVHKVLFLAGDSLGEAGLVAAAVDYFAVLAAEAGERLGPDHIDTLSARGHLALWRGETGDAVGAVDAYEALLADRLRVLGPDHPDTLTARHNLADWRGEAGDPGGAAAETEALLADRLRVQGPDHLATLTARNNLAMWQGQAGDAVAAADGFEALLADRLRVLGPDHLHTLATRGNLARWRGRAGDGAYAVTAFEALLPDMLRVLGPDHPHVLATYQELAAWRGEQGDAVRAVAELASLVADMVRVLGPDHPRTLKTRADLDRWRAEAGDVPAAVAELDSTIADMTRVLGPDHMHTVTARGSFARWQRQAEPPPST